MHDWMRGLGRGVVAAGKGAGWSGLCRRDAGGRAAGRLIREMPGLKRVALGSLWGV